MKKTLLFLTIICLVSSCKKEEISRNTPEDYTEFPGLSNTDKITPYPVDSSYTVSSLPNGESERIRLNQNFTPSDFTPTGWYAEERSTIVVNLKRIKGDYYPSLIVGTYNKDIDKSSVKTYYLAPGKNIIEIDRAGLIFIRYPGLKNENQAIINFVSGVIPAPFYQAGKTSKEQWKGMLTTYSDCPDAIMYGGKIMIVTNRRAALDNAHENQEDMLSIANKIWNLQEEYSGLDGSSPLHTPNIHNHLMTETNNLDLYMFASTYGTAYNANTALQVLLNPRDLNTWGPWHELGHHHQQSSYLWEGLMEVTVNLYSLYIDKKMNANSNRINWSNVKAYMAQAQSLRNFDAIEDLFTKLAMYEQLTMTFGDDMFIKLHKLTRETPLATGATDANKKGYFALQASKASGKDLTLFFRAWGITIPATYSTQITALKLPVPTSDISKLGY